MLERKQWYSDVTVRSFVDKESGILFSRIYNVRMKSVTKIVENRLQKMCKRHDLYLSSHSSTCDSNNDMFICRLKCFFSMKEFADYLRKKFKDEQYSAKIKGLLALVVVGQNKYIYRIIQDNNNQHERK